ncbi:TPA: hypothetical protein DIV55_06930 [Patescibacteria group bacterium]|uniref:MGPA protein n=1 Tax=Candidatus Gottesmanbacteria bacterium GW2011_GWA1_43_11 TaxID=1618436 RepID=A0A0G1CFZ0_9BACT|nr:MAG: MGPA protein [Candidatus Gottesmanbacteria bacterium GW2011_GWA1_43_11]HCS79438.1 hypothetical protein [Patescibacteria group bacterium]
MNFTTEPQQLKDLLAGVSGSQSISILLPENCTRDAMAAGLALYLSLTQVGKNVKISCPRPVTVDWNRLIGINKVVTEISNKNFIISLDYIEGSIDRVSYNIEGDKFNLVIEPRAGSQHLFSEKNVHYNSSGGTIELIITIGAASPDLLGKNYTENKSLFTEKPIVVIDTNLANGKYGKLNVVQVDVTMSELMVALLKLAKLPITEDIAANLYDGLASGSRNFTTPGVTAETFETAAWLLKSGARKNVTSQFTSAQEELPRNEAAAPAPDEDQLPPDWLKPKIYKGASSLL